MRTYLDWQNEGVRRVDDLRIEHIIPELARLLRWVAQMKARAQCFCTCIVEYRSRCLDDLSIAEGRNRSDGRE